MSTTDPQNAIAAVDSARADRADEEEGLLRDLQVLVDLGLVEAAPSPAGVRYAPAAPAAVGRQVARTTDLPSRSTPIDALGVDPGPLPTASERYA